MNSSGWDKFREQAETELSQIRELIGKFAEVIERSKLSTPEFIEGAGLAGMLHSFYSGVENVMERASIEIDEEPLKGEAWHKALLKKMRETTAKRSAVISEGMLTRLTPYLAFRHYYRNSYATTVRWELMAPLVHNCSDVLFQFEKEIYLFLKQAPAPKTDDRTSS